MSERINKLLGDELYKAVKEKIGDKPFDLLDGFIPKSRYDEVSEKNKVYSEKVSTYEKQLEATKALLKDTEEYKTKYSELDKTYKNTLKAKDTELTNVTKRFLVKDTLSKSGAKHVDLLMKQIDLDKLLVDNDKLVGIDEVITGLKTTYGDLFVEQKNTSINEDKDKKQDSGKEINDFLKYI